jgi:hypothetical protein
MRTLSALTLVLCVSAAIDQLVLERLAKNLADRPASAAATRDRLLAVLAEPLRPTG